MYQSTTSKTQVLVKLFNQHQKKEPESNFYVSGLSGKEAIPLQHQGVARSDGVAVRGTGLPRPLGTPSPRRGI
jgi:hypothetical protein